MKTNGNKRRNRSGTSDVARILAYYENQTDEEAAREIETAREVRDSTWMLVPAELVPQVRKLIARRKKSA
ncbi:MAG TPA: hypothetical protein VGR35_00695 [Tepidisphaeraceae bacterium]|nr:hypothetical protein [Tepidisphaeraceae bacterium]